MQPAKSMVTLWLSAGARDEKVKVLRACRAVRLDEVVLGQYTAGAGMEGYLEDKVRQALNRKASCPLQSTYDWLPCLWDLASA